jgi:hypothetical protein
MPILELDEAPNHPQNLARKSFVKNSKGRYEPVKYLNISNSDQEWSQKLRSIFLLDCWELLL